MKYDDSEAHFLEFTTDLPNECGATHIGMYLAWLCERELVSPELQPYVHAIKTREITGRTLLLDQCDGQLHEWALSELGNAFTEAYYETGYLRDYAAVLGPDPVPDGLYRFEDAWPNYRRLAERLDERYVAWRRTVSDSAGDLPDREALLDRVQAALWPFLAAEGLQPDPSAKPWSSSIGQERVFGAPFPDGHHRVGITVVDKRPEAIRFFVNVYSRHDALSRASKMVWRAGGVAVGDELLHTQLLQQKAWMGPVEGVYPGPRGDCIYEAMSAAELDAAVAHLTSNVRQRIPPLLRQMETVTGLDALYNTRPLSDSLLFHGYSQPEPLLIAQMAGNPRLLEICEEVERELLAVNPRWQSDGIAVTRLVQKLRR